MRLNGHVADMGGTIDRYAGLGRKPEGRESYVAV